jgi:hypothetical protein
MNPDPDQGYNFWKNPDSDPHKMHADPQPQDLYVIPNWNEVSLSSKQRLLSFSHFYACQVVIVTGRTIGTVPDSITDHSH